MKEWRMRFLIMLVVLTGLAVGQAQDPGSMAAKVDKTDVRLSDARTPTAHTHGIADIADYSAPAESEPFLGWHPIVFIKAGTCPAGWTEVAGMDGFYVLGTKAADGDVGTTGGNTAYTPAGTIASTFTGSQVTTSAVSAGTSAGTNSAPAFTGTAASLTHTATATTTKLVTGNTSTGVTMAAHSYTPQGTVAAPTFTGSALATHTHTDTATGTVVSTLTGTPATIQPPYIKLIPCEKQ